MGSDKNRTSLASLASLACLACYELASERAQLTYRYGDDWNFLLWNLGVR